MLKKITFSTLDEDQDLPTPNSSATGTLKDFMLNVEKTDRDIETACVEPPGGKKCCIVFGFGSTYKSCDLFRADTHVFISTSFV